MSLNRSLLDAVKENDLDLVKELLQHSVEVNCTDEVCDIATIRFVFRTGNKSFPTIQFS